jgi:hypothetical protein
MSYSTGGAYFKNPGPVYDGPTFHAPVPGWGVLPNMAGPARLGVGATRFKSGAGWTRESAAAAKERAKERGWVDPDDSPDESSDDSSDDEGGKPLPWWILPAAAVAIGGGLAVAYEFGWIGKKR